MMRMLIAVLAVGSLGAQQQASISGRVTAAGSGEPIAGTEVYLNRGTPKQVKAEVDVQGRYVLRGVEPGQHRVMAVSPPPGGRSGITPYANRQVSIQAGQEVTGFDFHLIVPGQIRGRVVDQNKEPVPGCSVFLVTREYNAGVLLPVFAGMTTTNDQGEYVLERAQPGRAYTVLAKKFVRALDAVSDAPADAKLRLPAVVPTYFPNSTTAEGAETFVLRSGEQREDINIRLTRSASYCADAVVAGGTSMSELRFTISEAEPRSGSAGESAVYISLPGGVVGPDGKLRICNLHPGDYELTVQQFGKIQFGPSPFFGTATLVVSNRDLRDVSVMAHGRQRLSGEVVWAGPAPEPPVTTKLSINLLALTRTERGNVQTTIPGEFEFEGGLLMDEYRITFRGVPPDAYVKEIAHGDRNLLVEPLRVGSTMGERGLRVVLGRDGAKVTVKAADREGNPAADCTVVLMPGAAANEAAMSAQLVTGKTDQNGVWTSETLAPGRYLALATQDLVEKSPEIIGRLWVMRGAAKEVELRPSTPASVTVAVKALQ